MKFRALLYALGGVAWALVPLAAQAALVPCGGVSGSTAWGQPGNSLSCDLCYLGELIQNVINFAIGISIPLAAALFAYAGILYFIAGGDTTRIDRAHAVFRRVFIGFLIVLSAWLLVQTLLNALVQKNFFSAIGGNWNTLNCTATRQQRQQTTVYTLQNFLQTSLPRLSSYDPNKAGAAQYLQFSSAQLAERVNATRGSIADIQNACEANGLINCSQYVQAIMTIESSGRADIGCSNAGACGLMQIKPGTARTLDPSLAGLTDAQIITKLNSDPNYSLALGTQYYGQMLSLTQNDPYLAAAAYNGGPGALDSSADCPGLRKYQCPWDSPGCWNTSNTNCKINTGYQETRNYVTNFTNTLNQLK